MFGSTIQCSFIYWLNNTVKCGLNYCKGKMGMMGLINTNGIIIITKQFISHESFQKLRSSVGRGHIDIGYIFLKSNKEIVA